MSSSLRDYLALEAAAAVLERLGRARAVEGVHDAMDALWYVLDVGDRALLNDPARAAGEAFRDEG